MTTSLSIDVQLSDDDLAAALRADARAGLTATRKSLPSKWFYDVRGSKLFDAITELPEYYPTRTERALLRDRAGEIALAAPGVQELVELGSGSSEKTRLLLRAFGARGALHTYLPQDVSETALREAADWIHTEFPALSVHGVVSDFTSMLGALPRRGRRMVVLLGGTLGNFARPQRAEFFARVREILDPGEHLLLGVGLAVDPAIMVPAYDDAAGVTAEFNRNVLHVMNERLGADFVPNRFRHVAVWDAENEWIEMRLEATEDHTVALGELGLSIPFAAGEQMRTEISAKFRLDAFRAELAEAGFPVQCSWTDPDDRFALVLGSMR
ncbi:L-histidine N(alpha)-methyltransferase [Nocardia aurantia]|uniref:Histidine N-alpha-methyltransferase n=1 Tax=Nocardia aurantia TaxID=2585199 RepID=A0A7K0DRK0_9NOCA|nr:L-histidine N(alpha)-methyltransferase [Nocardia aurantia]MQY28228.1 Histidine N-alpha-methyltransferase [Nocardia aurantia]